MKLPCNIMTFGLIVNDVGHFFYKKSVL